MDIDIILQARHLIETATNEYWCDDYLIRMDGVECFRLNGKTADNFMIYDVITAIHDFDPKINTLEAFVKKKKSMIRKSMKKMKEAEAQANENLNRTPPQPLPSVDAQ